MSTDLFFMHEGSPHEFTLGDLKKLCEELNTLGGVDDNTIIDGIRLKFSGNYPSAFLNECGEIVIYD